MLSMLRQCFLRGYTKYSLHVHLKRITITITKLSLTLLHPTARMTYIIVYILYYIYI